MLTEVLGSAYITEVVKKKEEEEEAGSQVQEIMERS